MSSHKIVLKHIDKTIADDYKDLSLGSYCLDHPIYLNLAKKISELTAELAKQRNSTKNCSQSSGNCQNDIEPKNP